MKIQPYYLIKIAIALTSIFMTTSCAPMISGAMNASETEESISTKTAEYFDVSENEIAIYKIKKSALSTSYKIKLNDNVYNCSVYYGAVTCKQPGTE